MTAIRRYPHIRRLQREFPDVPISLIVGADRAANGKVGVLCALATARATPRLASE